MAAAESIKDRNSFEKWLRSRQGESTFDEVRTLASRIALRVLPIAASVELKFEPTKFEKQFTYIFWCMTVIRAQSDPNNLAVGAASYRAQDALFEKARSILNGTHLLVINAIANVTTIAADAVNFTESGPESSVDALLNAASAAGLAAGGYVEPGYVQPGYVENEGDDFWEAISNDAGRLEQGLRPRELSFIPIWGRDPPDWWHKISTEFQRYVADHQQQESGFSIWKEWYAAAVDGQPIFNLKRSSAIALEANLAIGSRTGSFNQEFWHREPKEVNADIARWVEEARAQDRMALGDGDVLEQRPSTYVFADVDGKISAAPTSAPAAQLDLAGNMRREIMRKASEAAQRCKRSQTPQKFSDDAKRLEEFLDAVLDEAPEIGKLLMLSQSIATDARVLASSQFRAEYGLGDDIPAYFEDLLESVEHYKAFFPEIHAIETQRMSLRLKTGDADSAYSLTNSIADVANQSAIVADSAKQALKQGKDKLVELNATITQSVDDKAVVAAIEEKAAIVGQRIIVSRNFSAMVVKIAKSNSNAFGRGWLTGIEKTGEKAPGLVLGLLLGAVAGPIAGLATFASTLLPLARKVEEVKKSMDDDMADV